MNTWRLTTYDETWALLRTGVAHAFENKKADPQRPCARELSLVVRDVVQVRRWEKALYESLRDELQAQADACVSQCNDVKTVAAAWRSFNKALGTVVTVFRCLDACYASRTERGLDGVHRVGTKALRRSLEQRGLYEPITRKLVKMTRPPVPLSEEQVADCRACVECFQKMDWYASSGAEGPYIEELVLRDARDRFTREACASASDANTQARFFVQCVGDALDACAATFLDASTRPLLESVVVERLVAPSIAHVVVTGVGTLLDEALAGDTSAVHVLKRLGDLARRGGAVEDLRWAVSTHAGKLARDTLTSSDERVGPLVLKVLDALTTIVEAAFAPPESVEAIPTDVWDAFHKSEEAPTKLCEVKCVEDAFEEALNGDDERFAVCAARCFDATLSENKTPSMRLFRLCRAKDVFEANYRADLGLRLLGHLTTKTSHGALGREHDSIKRMGDECGASYVAKLEGMCVDALRSRTMVKGFSSTIANPTLLTRGPWPAYPECTLVLPPPLAQAKVEFEQWYASNHQGRKLRWHDDLGSCSVQATYSNDTLVLDVVPAQACFLLVLDNGACLSREALSTKVGLDGASFDTVAASLIEARLIVCVDNVYEATRRRPVQNTIAPPRHDAAAPLRAKVADAVRKDRAYAVDAAIVRAMKARRTLPQKRLVADVLRALVHPASDGDVMARVESLVEREYLESSSPGVFNYLA